VKNPFILILILAIGLASCAAPKKALIIAEAPKESGEVKAPAPSVPTAPAQANDYLRSPDMFALPDEEQLRSSATESPGDSAVIVRPPAE